METDHQEAVPRAKIAPSPDSAPVARRTTIVVGDADDHLEHEADQIADGVMQRLRNPAESGAEDGEGVGPSRVRRAAVARSGDPGSDPSSAKGGALSEQTDARVRRAMRGGSPIEDGQRAKMESGFGGADFSGTRIHTGAEASALNREMGAKAFTIDSHVFFRDGSPGSGQGGQRLLAHELAHTLQQSGPGRRTIQRFDFFRGRKADKHRLKGDLPAAASLSNVNQGYDAAKATAQGDIDDGAGQHGTANDALGGLQSGMVSPGDFSGANSFVGDLHQAQNPQLYANGATPSAPGKVGTTTDQNNLSHAAAAISAFGLVVEVSKLVQVFMDTDSSKMAKAEAVFGVATSSASTAKAISGSTKIGQSAASGSTTDIADKVLGEISGMLTTLQAGFTLVKQIHAFAKSDSDQDKAVAAAGSIKAVLEAGKGTIDTINAFMSHLGTVTGPMLQAAPAIGIAVNCIDMIMNGINLGYSYCAWADMQGDKRASKEELLGRPAEKSKGIRGFFGGHKSAKGAAADAITNKDVVAQELLAAAAALDQAAAQLGSADDEVRRLEAELVRLKSLKRPPNAKNKRKPTEEEWAAFGAEIGVVEDDLEAAKADQTSKGSLQTTAREDRDRRATASTAATTKAEQAAEYQVSKSLQRIAAKRINRAVLNIGLTIPAIAGDIAILSGAGAAAGAGLKAASGGGKLLAVGIRMAKQAYHNHKQDSKSATNKLAGYDDLIRAMTQHAIDADGDSGKQEKATREIVASGMTLPTMERLKTQPDKLYTKWLEALKKR